MNENVLCVCVYVYVFIVSQKKKKYFDLTHVENLNVRWCPGVNSHVNTIPSFDSQKLFPELHCVVLDISRQY